MGIIQPTYKEAILQDVITCMETGVSYYYAFAANPVAYAADVIPTLTNDDYTAKFTNDWQMLFGKLINSSDVLPVVNNNVWTANSVYTQYDNTSTTLYSNNNYYVVSPPSVSGAGYQFYVCINNANGSPSTVQPTLVQPTTFTTSDGYSWRYITTVAYSDYVNFASGSYIPIYPNTIIQASANTYAGIDNVVITNGGSGYLAYLNGTVQGGNSTVLQIDSFAYPASGYYNNSGIYVYQNTTSVGQLAVVNSYVSNSSGNFVQLNTALTGLSIGSITYYYTISPQVLFTSDTNANTPILAYSVVNSAFSNSISNVVILQTGTNISWANVTFVTNSSLVTTNASAYVVVPPPGGHGADPATELGVSGFSVFFQFSNSELGSIPTNILYNKIGIIKNPVAANSLWGYSNGTPFTSNTFNQLLVAGVTTQFAVGTQLVGLTSNAVGTVAFCNTSVMYLTGDKYFVDFETVQNVSNSYQNTVLTIVSLGNLYTKNTNPLYIANISNINRANGQTEAYKLVIQI